MENTWYILGAGAIGHLLAYKLHKAGLPVCLLLRENGMQREAFELVHADTENSEKPTLPYKRVHELEPGEIARLIVTTKANQACDAFATIASHLALNAHCLLLHNGMGVYERLLERYPQQSIALGATTEAAFWRDTNALVYAGRGKTHIGHPGSKKPLQWTRDLLSADLDFEWEPDIERRMWAKLTINCAINPLSALHRCSNGELGRDPALRESVGVLCEELALVTAARGHEDLAQTIEESVFSVIDSTAQNYSSMMRDVDRGQKTEVEHITGYLIAEAEAHDIPCPANRELLMRIRQLEKSWSTLARL